MELPAALRQAVDAALEGVPLAVLKQAAETLSRRYRAEIRDGRLHLSDDMAAKAYLATRLPATYAAVRASLEAMAQIHETFAPQSLLDVGAGPGTALWAARDRWPALAQATLLEASDTIRAMGADLARHAEPVATHYLAADVTGPWPALQPADLVTLAYVLDELAPGAIAPLIERLWSLTGDVLIVIEPGTPAGWQRILAVREQLIAKGAHIIAPCPHQSSCPVQTPDWCHFSRRVARSRLHRLSKNADVPWEDEKFIYLAASRHAVSIDEVKGRVLAPPHQASGRVRLKLCQTDGGLAEPLITRRDGPAFKIARRLDWGDILTVSPPT